MIEIEDQIRASLESTSRMIEPPQLDLCEPSSRQEPKETTLTRSHTETTLEDSIPSPAESGDPAVSGEAVTLGEASDPPPGLSDASKVSATTDTTALPRLSRPLSRREYAQRLQTLDHLLASVHRPLRLLEAVGWCPTVERDFLARHGLMPPYVNADYYRNKPLNFEPKNLLGEIRDLEQDIRRQLGEGDPAARLMLVRCRGCRDAVSLIESRGTREFGYISRRVYGSALKNAGEHHAIERVCHFLDRLRETLQKTETDPPERIDAEKASRIFRRRMKSFFGAKRVCVKLVDHLHADASATGDILKIRRGAHFLKSELDTLEAHEAWVHLGTTLNGRSQPALPCLGRCGWTTTRTQEGLAVLMEFLRGGLTSKRVGRLSMRLQAGSMAEAGADFLQVHRFFMERGQEIGEAYRNTSRVFRGALPSGGSVFTKDLCYGLGLLDVTQWLRERLVENRFDAISLLFVGKISLDEIPLIDEVRANGWLAMGEFTPPPFASRESLVKSLHAVRAL